MRKIIVHEFITQEPRIFDDPFGHLLIKSSNHHYPSGSAGIDKKILNYNYHLLLYTIINSDGE